MKEILRLKHWQVFSIIAIGYIISYVLPMINFKIGGITSIELAAIATIITLILLFSYTLTIGLFLNNIKNNTYHFKNWILIIAILCCILGYSDLSLLRLKLDDEFIPFWIGFISTPLTFCGVCYAYYSVAKSLKSIELDREAKFSECIIDAITLFALPIGVWFIQPRLNRILTVVE
ncbi:MAG: hypothetical protein Q8904_15055 [Bacteroidota bacterium]|nr:hypothetical protein [Bacteroidota bacterium]